MTTVRYPLEGAPPQNGLAARVAAGDREAFVGVYRAHFAEVRAFAERVLGCRASAEDVVHDVFLALPEALRTFRGDSSLRSFILSIAVRSARTRYRSAVRRSRHERVGAQSLQWSAPLPDTETERKELALLLARALDALPVDQRVAFVLCEVEERTSVEVADILGENASTIRARVFHAKRKLREELETLTGRKRAAERGGAQ